LLPHGDKDNRRRVAEGAGIDLEQAKSLTPLPGNGTGREVPGKYLNKRSVRSRPFAADLYGEKRG
jgi:catalase